MDFHLSTKQVPFFSVIMTCILLMISSCNPSQQNPESSTIEPDSVNTEETQPQPETAETITPATCTYKSIPGRIGSDKNFDAGWIDLLESQNFKVGNKVKLKVGGTAEEIVVRFLPEGEQPGSPTGIVDKFTVPLDKEIEIILAEEYSNIVQISVHGGPNPWRIYKLVPGNGFALIEKVSKCD